MTKKVVLKEYCAEIETLKSQLQLTREKNGYELTHFFLSIFVLILHTIEAQCNGILKQNNLVEVSRL